jgi:hypothetical protein
VLHHDGVPQAVLAGDVLPFGEPDTGPPISGDDVDETSPDIILAGGLPSLEGEAVALLSS